MVPVVPDHVVVAAFNGCVDLNKWKDLPLAVKERFTRLLCHNRVKAVCFFNEVGFGLRIYREQIDKLKLEHDGGDEFDTAHVTTALHVDLEGSWMRCPASLWEDQKKTNKLKLDRVVMDEFGIMYFTGWDAVVKEEEDVEESDEGDNTEDTTKQQKPKWRVNRRGAMRMTLEEATKVAAKIPGSMIVKHS